MVVETKPKPNCPACGSGNVMSRKGGKELWCRRCGHVWKQEGG